MGLSLLKLKPFLYGKLSYAFRIRAPRSIGILKKSHNSYFTRIYHKKICDWILRCKKTRPLPSSV